MNSKLSQSEIDLAKYDLLMHVIAWKAGYYRENPDKFVSEVLFAGTNFALKWFQKILLYALMHYNYFMYFAARSQGKTFLVALFCCIRCILYPGTKIVVASGTLKQANEVLLKIQDEFMPLSPFLRAEIKSCSIGQNDSAIYFWNNSFIKTRTSTQNSRSARANIIVLDEFRMIDKTIMDTVLRKFNGNPRNPGYLNRPEYAHLKERNKEVYMSSCWFKSHYSYEKAVSYVKNFLRPDKKYFICGLPYQLSIREGLLIRGQVEDEMSEADFDLLKFQMEMECLWYGNDVDSLFKLDEFNACRKIKNSFYPMKFYNDRIRVPELSSAEKRILSVDVALMISSKKRKNDASALYINSCIQMDDVSYKSNIVYGETFEGLTTDALGLIIMRYFYFYKCTDLVLDTLGLGLGVYDFIIKDQYDPENGKTYKALTCINDDDMASRCKVKDANKVVWSVKANAGFNNEICVLLRNAIQNKKINFLVNDEDADDIVREKFKSYGKMSPSDQVYLKTAYYQTTFAEYELVKLNHENVNGNIKVKEVSGMRKDRYSSIAYNLWCARQLELRLKPRSVDSNDIYKYVHFRVPRKVTSYS